MDAFSESELAALEALLELPENDLADWLTGRLPIPPEADTPMLRRIRDEAADDDDVLPPRQREVWPMTATPVFGAPEGWDAFLLARRRGEFSGPVLHVTRDDARMARLAEALAFVVPEAEVLRFPAWDCLPYDRVSPNPALVSERIATLARLLEKPTRPRIVLTTVNALVQRVPPRSAFAGASLELRTNGTVAAGEAGAVPGGQRLRPRRHGDGAGRIRHARRHHRHLPRRRDRPGPARPVRRHDRVDPRLRSRHPAQRRPSPAADAAPGVRGAARPGRDLALPLGWRDMFGQPAADDPIYLSISDGRRHPGMEHWVPLFHERMETLLDYLPGASVSLDHQADEVLAARLEMIADHYAARRLVPRDGEVPYRPLPPDRLYLDQAGWDAMLAGRPAVRVLAVRQARWRGRRRWRRPSRAGVLPERRPRHQRVRPVARPGRTLERRGEADRHRRLDARLARTARQPAARARLPAIPRRKTTGRRSARKPPGSVSLVTLGVERGFVADQLALVGEQDLLGERISRPPRRRKRADQFIAEATEIAEGDLVVHQEYGIGRYDGLETLTVTGAPHDCLRLIYDGDEKLFLPVENIEVLSRFGSETPGRGARQAGRRSPGSRARRG